MTDLEHRPSAANYAESGVAIQRQGFGSSELERRNETQASAAAEYARAMVQARYIVAIQRPRDVDDFRARLLKHCRRPGFAAIAEYAKPVGGGTVRGMSIRFVEAALQEYGNVSPEVMAVYDDDEKRIVRISLTDLERNITYTEDATIEKFVERKSSVGAEVIGERRKKNGDIVYKVRATEDDFNNKLAAAVSKKIRNLGLRILPPDIVDEARTISTKTRQDKSASDPDAERKSIADAFATLRVMPSDIKDYLAHDIGTASPAQLDDLRMVYVAIRDGDTTWAETMKTERARRGELDAKPVDAVADKLKAKLATSAPKKEDAQ